MCRALAMADSNVSSDESGPTPEKKGHVHIQLSDELLVY